MTFNIVEMIADADNSAFDQPCKWGHRVEGHAVYCHNETWDDSPRKCRRSWYTGNKVKDEDCPGYEVNPAFTGLLCPTPVEKPLCRRCEGVRTISTDRGKRETCPRCMGDGTDPRAMQLSSFAQNTLELGSGHSAHHDAVNEYFVRMVETEAQMDDVILLIEHRLVEMRSVSSRPGLSVYLLRMTAKGDAVMRANWRRPKKDKPR